MAVTLLVRFAGWRQRVRPCRPAGRVAPASPSRVDEPTATGRPDPCTAWPTHRIRWVLEAQGAAPRPAAEPAAPAPPPAAPRKVPG